MKTVIEFEKFTNIKTCCEAEMKFRRSNRVSNNIDEMIKFVFEKLVHIREAWFWTFLCHLHIKPTYFVSGNQNAAVSFQTFTQD